MDETQQLPKIVVTGISGRLGRLVVRELHRRGDCRVVGIDQRSVRGLPKDVEHLQVDIRSRRAREVFRGGQVAALVHLGLLHNPRVHPTEHHRFNVAGTAHLLDCCADYRVPKVVVLSSADVYGPRPDNKQFLTEDDPLMGAAHFPAIRDLIAVDMQATAFFWRAAERQNDGAGSRTETVVLRPVHILGRVRNAASNYLRLKRVPVLLGYDPMIQLIHEYDVVQAILTALRPGVLGVFNLPGPGALPLSAILRELGREALPLPVSLLRSSMWLSWKLHLASFPVPELEVIRYIGMVDGTRAQRILGFEPQHGLRETIHAVDAQFD